MVEGAEPKGMHRAVILGAGQIACGYDRPGDKAVLTHAHAISRTEGLECVGLFDVDPPRAAEAGAKWGLPALSSFDEAMALEPDLVVIAVPDEFHEEYLRRLVPYRPRTVLCEKPLTKSFEAAEEIAAAYREAGIALAVNYQRRFDPVVLALKQRIADGSAGRPLAGQVLYSKGIRHNGSHAVDLLRFLFGEPVSFVVERQVEDFRPDDPTVAGSLRFSDLDIAFVAADERLFSLFEIDLFFAAERMRFTHSGLRFERYEVMPDPVFAGYRELFPAEAGDSGLPQAMLATHAALARFLGGDEAARPDFQDFLGTQRVCETMARAPLDRRIEMSAATKQGGEAG